MLKYEENDIYSPFFSMLKEMDKLKDIFQNIQKNYNIIHEGGILNICSCFGSLQEHMKYIGKMIDVTEEDFNNVYHINQKSIQNCYNQTMMKEIIDAVTIENLFKVLGSYYTGPWVELGVRNGDGIMRMIRGGARCVYGVDSWIDDGNKGRNDINLSPLELKRVRDECFKRFQNNKHVTLIEGYTFDVVKQFQDGFFDVVFIDADHTYEAVKEDMKDWWRKVRPGGVMCGHDYLDITINNGVKFGVVKAFHEFISEYNITSYHITSESSASWVMVKNE